MLSPRSQLLPTSQTCSHAVQILPKGSLVSLPAMGASNDAKRCTFLAPRTRLLRILLKQSDESFVTEDRGLSRREFLARASASALAASSGYTGGKSMTERKEGLTNELL